MKQKNPKGKSKIVRSDKEFNKAVKKAKKKDVIFFDEGVKEVSDKELADLEKEVKKLPDKYGSPQPDYNKGMVLQLTMGSFVVFKNDSGILYQIGINPEIEELVLKKIKVV